MKILFSAAGSRGDVYPLLYLGRELQRRGHLILFATTPDFREECEAEGFIFFSMGSNFRVLMDRFESYMGKPLKVMSEGFAILQRELHYYYEAALEAGEGADLLVVSGVQFIGPAVAETLGIPYRYVVHIPILLPTAYHAPVFVPFQNMPKFLNRFFWFLDRMSTKFTVNKTINEIRKGAGLAPKKSISDHVDPSSLVVAVAPELGPIAPDNQDIGLQTDYLFNPDEGELSPEIKLFLAAGEKPIYFGFGSMTDGDAHKTLEIIFKAVEQLQIRAVISRGWANYTVEHLPQGVFFAGEEPHGKLFPKMSCIVHHGGAGTCSQAVRSGVPQITLPHVLDQYYWTDRLVKLGVSPGGITKRRFSVSTLVEKLRQVMTTEEYHKKAKVLGKQLQARNGIKGLADHLETLFE